MMFSEFSHYTVKYKYCECNDWDILSELKLSSYCHFYVMNDVK